MDGREWGLIIEQVRELEFVQRELAEQYENKRKENIEIRYDLLRQALALKYADDQTLGYIADLGSEFGSGKAYEYFGTSIFRRSEVKEQ